MEILQQPNGEVENDFDAYDFGALLRSLFQLTMQKKWEFVLEFYQTHSWAHKARLTIYGETALHVAISSYHSGPQGTKATDIRGMIECIPNEQKFNTLSMKNNRGNTPLHLAATVGSIAVCEDIAAQWPDLIKIRNSNGETPVFMAAIHGNTEVFLCFNHFYNEKKEEGQQRFESLCRRKDGNTVLHSAISGAYFGLAYQIIHYYPNLVKSVNVVEESPLLVLAKMPKVFKSSSYLGFYDSIIYDCLIVDELKKQEYNQGANQNVLSPTSAINFPENYRTCVNIFHFLWDPILRSCKAGFDCDEENQQITEDGLFPPNYATCLMLVKFGFKVFLTLLGIGVWRIRKIQEKKQRWTHSLQVMNKMIELSDSSYYDDGQKPVPKDEPLYRERVYQLPDITHSRTETNPRTTPSGEVKKHTDKATDQSQSMKSGKETPILVAAKMGITEMVEKILDKWPVAIQDLDSNEKNALLLAAENRQTRVFEFLVQNLPEYMFHQVDNKGNSILHLAATLGESHPWRIPGAALQMQWEIKWYKFVKDSIPRLGFARPNINGETAKQIFTSQHGNLVKYGARWLTKTSESCSLIAALTATVALATSSTVPGGVDNDTGYPIFRDHAAFQVFSISSVLALCLSMSALVFFLSIISSNCQQRDFKEELPWKLMMGLTTLFASLAAIAVSFLAGHTFILKENLRFVAFPLYCVACAPLAFLVIKKLPLYFDLLSASYRKELKILRAGKTASISRPYS